MIMKTIKQLREDSVCAYVEKTYVVACFHREILAVAFESHHVSMHMYMQEAPVPYHINRGSLLLR